MVRFHLRDDDGDDTSTTEDLIDAMTEYNERQNDYPAHSQFADHSLPTDDNNNAPAFIVAYQRNGTPFLVPYTPPKQPRRILWWFWIMVLATLTQLVLWYGPPAPPSQNETWHEFFRREAGALVQSASALLSVIPHVSHWISKELHAEVTELLKSPPCPLEVPSDFVGLEESIIGQSRAVTVTTQALHAWKKDDKALILVLSGTVGVGKLRLAQHVAARTMCENAVVKIQGRDYSYRHDLVAQLQQHAVAGGGSIIIIQHPEDMAPLLLSKALEALASTPNLIILITTHIGSRNIHRHLKDEGSSSSSSLDWALRHELDTELGQGVSEYVTAVAPFVPLGPSELQYIFIHKVRSLNLDMTLELAQAWTSPQHVEYLEWTSHGRTILTLSSRGAKVLDGEIWQRLVSQVQRCIGSKSAHQLDWDEDEAVIRVCNEDMCEEVCRFELASY